MIKCLLIIPFPESSLNEEAGKLFMEDYEKYFKIASIFTSVHAVSKESGNKEDLKPIFYNNSNMSSGSFYDRSHLSNNNFIFNQEKLMATPTDSNSGNEVIDAPFNYSLLRHSRSVNVKSSSQMSQLLTLKRNQDNFENSNNRKFSQLDSNIEANKSEIKSCQKPNINHLPFIMRSNSITQTENENIMNHGNSFVNSQNTNNSGFSYASLNPTPKSKKDEIKKWLSRI